MVRGNEGLGLGADAPDSAVNVLPTPGGPERSRMIPLPILTISKIRHLMFTIECFCVPFP